MSQLDVPEINEAMTDAQLDMRLKSKSAELLPYLGQLLLALRADIGRADTKLNDEDMLATLGIRRGRKLPKADD